VPARFGRWRSCTCPRRSAGPQEADHLVRYINRLFSANSGHPIVGKAVEDFDPKTAPPEKSTSTARLRQVSSNGGVLLLRAADRRLGLSAAAAGVLRDPRDHGRCRDSALAQLRQRLLGGNRLGLKLLKIGAVIWRNTRRIRFCLSSACPDQHLFMAVAQRLTAAPRR
jgi:hypothetical protein